MSERNAPALIQEAKLVDLDAALSEREHEAAILARAGCHSMGMALRFYSLEIRLKVRICRHLGLTLLPRACKTHDLTELLVFTGLWSELQTAGNELVNRNWATLADYSKKHVNDLRYLPTSDMIDTVRTGLTAALDDPTDGIL